MSKDKVWIEHGYQAFAQEGPSGLLVERLAKSSQKSKSSFYHFFADLEVFTQRLLAYHLERVKLLAEKEAEAQNESGLIDVLIEHKIDLLFNRQLRVHRDNAAFQACFLKTNEISLPGFVPVWKKVVGLKENNYLAQLVLMLSIENFFLQITEETLNPTWLAAYFENIRAMVRQFKIADTSKRLDGSV